MSAHHPLHYPLSIAPMMERTDRHFRFLMRQITRCTLLYSEMITTAAILNGDRPKLLGFSPEEKPLMLQLGGDDPKALADCSRIAADFGYDGLNLNVGCPSPRVKQGNFGACLMTQPHRVAEAIAAMQGACSVPVSVKHRLGVDECDHFEDLVNFVEIVSQTGCRHFTIHARKAWLQGLSPKENRTIPPLRYDRVYRLKAMFPELFIEINGGITQLVDVHSHLQRVDAVMIGRAAYDNPYLFATVDRDFFDQPTPPPQRTDIVEAMVPYIERWMKKGLKLSAISRHLLQLFAGEPGTKVWKRYLSEQVHRPNANATTIEEALQVVRRHVGEINDRQAQALASILP